MIGQGLDFMMSAGQQGHLSDGRLRLGKEVYATLLKEYKIKKPFLAGLAGIGWTVSEAGEDIAITCPPHPGMPLALKALAEACGRYQDTRLGKFNFARGDFRALDGKFSPAAFDLYVLEPEARAASPPANSSWSCTTSPSSASQRLNWQVQYQVLPKSRERRCCLQCDSLPGPTASRYQVRQRHPREPGLQAAGFLQEDFNRRAITCGNCTWCDGKKAGTDGLRVRRGAADDLLVP
jgi:hypothetical protein